MVKTAEKRRPKNKHIGTTCSTNNKYYKKHRKENKNKIGSNGLHAKSDIGVRVDHLNCNVNRNLVELRRK